jgi:hypothetical protein
LAPPPASSSSKAELNKSVLLILEAASAYLSTLHGGVRQRRPTPLVVNYLDAVKAVLRSEGRRVDGR